jgi:hypothetical protein
MSVRRPQHSALPIDMVGDGDGGMGRWAEGGGRRVELGFND